MANIRKSKEYKQFLAAAAVLSLDGGPLKSSVEWSPPLYGPVKKQLNTMREQARRMRQADRLRKKRES